MKKFFIVVTVLLVILLIAWGVVSYVLPQTPTTVEDVADTPIVQEDIKDTTNALLRNITSVPVRDYIFTPDDDTTLQIWNAVDDAIYRIDVHGGNMEKMKYLSLPDVREVQWSKNNAVLIKTKDAYYTYDFDTEDLRRVKDGIDYAAWAQTPGEIVYKYFDPATKTRTLNVLRPGDAWRELTTIPYRYVQTQPVPLSTQIAYWPRPSAYSRSTLNTIGIIGTQKPVQVYDGLYGASYLYAPNGKNILISSTLSKGGKAMTLAVSNEHGGEYHNLSIPTFVEKAVWSKDNQTIYYALPNDFPQDSVMPDDYERELFTTRDTFWKLDTTTGKKKRLIALEDISEKIDATHLMLSPAEDTLYFINRINGLLYALSL